MMVWEIVGAGAKDLEVRWLGLCELRMLERWALRGEKVRMCED